MTLCGVHDGEVGPGEVVEVAPARLTLGVQLPPHEHGAESTEGSVVGYNDKFWPSKKYLPTLRIVKKVMRPCNPKLQCSA